MHSLKEIMKNVEDIARVSKKLARFDIYEFNTSTGEFEKSQNIYAIYEAKPPFSSIKIIQSGINNINNPHHIINLYKLFTFWNKIEQCLTPGHKDIKGDHNWLRCYQAMERSIPYVIGESEQSFTEITMPCHRCGVVLPLPLIEVDHYHPTSQQSKGPNRAIVKVLRAVGGTVGSPTGTKASAVFLQDIPNLSLLDPIPTKLKWMQGKTDQRKYILNELGMTIMGLIFDSGHFNLFRTSCLNSWMNLSPLCSNCNKGKYQTQNKI